MASELRVDRIIPTSGVATNQMGGAIQYVQAAHTRMTNRFSTTSTSYVQTNYDLTITPRSSSSKILIYANLSTHGNNDGYFYLKVYNVTASRYVNSEGNQSGRNIKFYNSTTPQFVIDSSGNSYFPQTVGIRTDDVTRANLANPVGAGHSLVGLYIGDGSLLFNNTLNRTGGYYISTETNALNAGPVTLDANMKVDGAWVIV